MWEKLFNGEIDCPVSDHSTMPSGNESRQHHGSMGRYCRPAKLYMDVMFDEAVQKRGMSLPMFGKLMATNAQIFSVCSKKAVSPEKRCRLRLSFSQNSSYVLTNDDLEYRHKVSPYVGRTIGARITKTILRGDVRIYDIEQGFLLRRKVNFILKHQQ